MNWLPFMAVSAVMNAIAVIFSICAIVAEGEAEILLTTIGFIYMTIGIAFLYIGIKLRWSS